MSISSALMLVSPNLPVGSFGYSQGLESFVEQKFVTDSDSFEKYLSHNLKYVLGYSDLPLLKRLYQSSDLKLFSYWTERTLALRTTEEFRAEEINKGKALVRLVKSLYQDIDSEFLETASSSYLAAFALFARYKKIPLNDVLESYAFSYLEGQCVAAIKLVPIGQSTAWMLIDRYVEEFENIIKLALNLEDDDIGSGLSSLSILSVMHESQYSRIFRS
ncbi:MAG: urease accessory protein UreF [Succinivibrio sp.]